jgi:hypothetical protein
MNHVESGGLRERARDASRVDAIEYAVRPSAIKSVIHLS